MTTYKIIATPNIIISTLIGIMIEAVSQSKLSVVNYNGIQAEGYFIKRFAEKHDKSFTSLYDINPLVSKNTCKEDIIHYCLSLLVNDGAIIPSTCGGYLVYPTHADFSLYSEKDTIAAYQQLQHLSYLTFSPNVLTILKEIIKERSKKLWIKQICPTKWQPARCNGLLSVGETLTKSEHITIVRFIQTVVNIPKSEWYTSNYDKFTVSCRIKCLSCDLLIRLLEEHFIHKVRKDSFYNGLLAKQ